MEVITTHVGADFDALASLVAASKLHPSAQVVLSGGADRNVADFLNLHQELLSFQPLKELDAAAITTLIVVETQSSARLGDLGAVALRPGVQVIVYDHHERGGDLPAAQAVIKHYGATTTILLEMLRARDIPVSPVEATIYLLGIYEDTGSLTFPSTTPADADAVAWLLRQGANLDVLSAFLIRGLTPAQRALLNELLAHVRYYDVNGARIAVTSATVSEYVEEVSLLAHRLADTEGVDALFVLVRMEENLLLVGRARTWGVDVAQVLEAFGGGGHERAASATLKDGDLQEVESRLVALLEKAVQPRATARDLMSWPVRTVGPDVAISDAAHLMQRYGISGLLVMEAGEPVGVLARRDVDKAERHHLSHAPVRAFMSRHVRPVAPETPLREIEYLMTEERVGRIPVMQQGRVIGIITRTDVLRALHQTSVLGGMPHPPHVKHTGPSVAEILQTRLPEWVQALLRQAGETGDALGVHVFVVGGFVRDLLLGVTNLDVDLVVEGDGIAFARRLSDLLHADATLHDRFGTAMLTLPDGFRVDIASTRTELYEHPAALPEVEYAPLRDDLARRDFTINALAVQLNAQAFGKLVDPFRGRRDLLGKRVRVLHPLSFVEDPTRLFRGVRFEARYGFHFSPGSERLARSAVAGHCLSDLSPARLRKEIVRTLKEEHAVAAIARWQDLGLLETLWPGLELRDETRVRLERVDSVLAWYNGIAAKRSAERWLLLLAVLIEPLGPAAASQFVETRLHLRAVYREILRDALYALPHLCAVLTQPWMENGRSGMRASEVYWACRDLPVEALLLAVIYTGADAARDRVALYLRELRHLRPRLSGDQLIALGYRPGPTVGAVLRELLDRRLDGELNTVEEELEYARKRLANDGEEIEGH